MVGHLDRNPAFTDEPSSVFMAAPGP